MSQNFHATMSGRHRPCLVFPHRSVEIVAFRLFGHLLVYTGVGFWEYCLISFCVIVSVDSIYSDSYLYFSWDYTDVSWVAAPSLVVLNMRRRSDYLSLSDWS